MKLKKILVLGAGVIGVTTAKFLKDKGFEVTVAERLKESGLYTSYANAGQLSYSYAFPWAYPGIVSKAIKWSLQKDSPLRIRPDYKNLRNQVSWLLEMLSNSSAYKYEQNKTEMLKISILSKKVLQSLLSTEEISATSFDWQSRGTLQLFRTKDQLKAAENDIKILHSSGVNAKFITDMAEISEKESGLQSAIDEGTVTGAIYLPDDETGDCHKFTQTLAKSLKINGVRFFYETHPIVSKNKSGNGFFASFGSIEQEQFDAVVICAGVHSPKLVTDLGGSAKYSIYPVKGYSLTFESEVGPESTIMDETNKIAITRLGSRVRMGGVAELNGFNFDLDEDRRKQFIAVFESLFGPSKQAHNGKFWTGLRPATPSSVPYVERVQGQERPLYINAGHGTLGWTMACACGYLTAEQVAQDLT